MPDGLRLVQSAATGAECVLVIDDDPDLLHSFTHVLQAYSIPIATARAGHEALAAFRWYSPGVVLTDIVAPEQYQTALAMRRARPKTKVVAMSDGAAVDKVDFLTIAKKFGPDAIVHKPFEISELVKLLRTFMRARW